MWRYIFGVGQRVYVCVFLFVIEEREVENGELEKKVKTDMNKKFEQKIWQNISRIKNISFSHFELILRNPINKKKKKN